MRDVTHPLSLGAFAGEGLLDPWLADPDRWYSTLHTFAAQVMAQVNLPLAIRPLPTAIIASLRIGIAPDGGRTFAILLRAIADARKRRDTGGCWMQLIDEIHRCSGPTRTAWLAQRERLRANAVDVVEVELLRDGEPLHPRPPGTVWSVIYRPRIGEPIVLTGGLRDPLPALDQPPSRSDDPCRRHCCDLPAIVRQHAADTQFAQVHVDYRRPLPVGLSPDDAAWAMARVAAWRARGGPAALGSGIT